MHLIIRVFFLNNDEFGIKNIILHQKYHPVASVLKTQSLLFKFTSA
jgi:hypothetical protein